MHSPNPNEPRPSNDDDKDEQPDVRQPPVPPDRAPDVIPQRDPPKPGRPKSDPPMIA
jgi:hypothetical protein